LQNDGDEETKHRQPQWKDHRIRIHSCLERPGAIPEAEIMSSGVLARAVSAWSRGTSCGAASASGIASGRSRQLWTRISMVFPARLAVKVFKIAFCKLANLAGRRNRAFGAGI
jgi:hypothetical protein